MAQYKSKSAGRVLTILAILALSLAGFASPAAAQSSGCAGGPFDGATATDSDGDGVSDGDEVAAGTDECDPAEAPTNVCGNWVTGYDATTADTDADGHTDAAETSAGTDHCDETSVIDANVTNNGANNTTDTTTTNNATNNTAAAAPTLALTGPSSATLLALVGMSLVLLGSASLAMGRRAEA